MGYLLLIFLLGPMPSDSTRIGVLDTRVVGTFATLGHCEQKAMEMKSRLQEPRFREFSVGCLEFTEVKEI